MKSGIPSPGEGLVYDGILRVPIPVSFGLLISYGGWDDFDYVSCILIGCQLKTMRE